MQEAVFETMYVSIYKLLDILQPGPYFSLQ